jgi:ABC-type transport system substrate-binding protein
MKKCVVVLLCMALVLSLAACASTQNSDSQETVSSGDTSSGDASSGAASSDNGASQPSEATDSIVVAYPTDPGNLSPFGTSNSFTDFIVYNLYETLFKLDDKTGEVVPVIMESYDLSDDGLIYTFHLNKGVKDINGNEITAQDCLFSFLLCKDSPVGSNTQTVDFDKTEAVDDYTFKLVTTSPGKIYMSQIAMIYIVSEKSYNDSPDQFVTTPVGTGPYKLDEWVQGSSVKLVANESYWNDNKPTVHNLEFKIIGEPSQRTNTLMTGECNFVYDYLISDADYINGTGGFKTEDRNTNTVFAIFFNCTEGKAGYDINFRKAVCLALNNEGLTNMIYKGHNTPATTCESNSCSDYTQAWEGSEFYKYDVEAAKEYLAQSSYDGSTLVLVTKSNVNNFDLLCEAVQNQLKQIGVTVEIQQYEAATLKTIILEQPEDWDMQIADHSTFSNYGVDSIYNMHIRRNYPHIEGELYDLFKEYCEKSISSTNDQECIEYATKAVQLNQDNCTIRGICYATMKIAYADYISNINTYATNKIDWREVIIG